MHPHVILITLDAFRADLVDGQEGAAPAAPNLTALTRDSVRFSRAISAGPWTLAALPAIMASAYPSGYGGVWAPLPANTPLLAEAFAAAGYHTAAVTANYLLDHKLGYDRGFDQFHQLGRQFDKAWFQNVRGAWRVLPSARWHRAMEKLGMIVYPDATPDAWRVVAAAGDCLSQAGGRPVFLWTHFMDTHDPYYPEEPPTDYRLRAEAWLACREYFRYLRTPRPPSDEVVALLRSLYLRAVTRLDAELGGFFELLRRAGLWEDAIVVVTADHGEELGEHGGLAHGSHELFDELLHVPLIIKLPGQLAGRCVTQPVSMADLAPTLLDLCGVAIPQGYRGRSLRPLW